MKKYWMVIFGVVAGLVAVVAVCMLVQQSVDIELGQTMAVDMQRAVILPIVAGAVGIGVFIKRNVAF